MSLSLAFSFVFQHSAYVSFFVEVMWTGTGIPGRSASAIWSGISSTGFLIFFNLFVICIVSKRKYIYFLMCFPLCIFLGGGILKISPTLNSKRCSHYRFIIFFKSLILPLVYQSQHCSFFGKYRLHSSAASTSSPFLL